MDVTSYLEVSLNTEDGEAKDGPASPLKESCKVEVKKEPQDELAENEDSHHTAEAELKDESSGDDCPQTQVGECERPLLVLLPDAAVKQEQQDMEEEEQEEGDEEEEEEEEETSGGSNAPRARGRGRGRGSRGGAWVGGPKKHACEQCGKGFATPSHLRTHQRTHTGTRPFRCGECPAAFAQSNNLRRHARTHTDARPYQCESCTCAFRDSSHLRRHRLLHTGERPFRCEHPGCTEAFAQSNTLRDHQRLHTGERPFRCDVPECVEAFVRRSHLNVHRARQHGLPPLLPPPHLRRHAQRDACSGETVTNDPLPPTLSLVKAEPQDEQEAVLPDAT